MKIGFYIKINFTFGEKHLPLWSK